jgi:hypothetical protein
MESRMRGYPQTFSVRQIYFLYFVAQFILPYEKASKFLGAVCVDIPRYFCTTPGRVKFIFFISSRNLFRFTIHISGYVGQIYVSCFLLCLSRSFRLRCQKVRFVRVRGLLLQKSWLLRMIFSCADVIFVLAIIFGFCTFCVWAWVSRRWWFRIADVRPEWVYISDDSEEEDGVTGWVPVTGKTGTNQHRWGGPKIVGHCQRRSS